MSGQHTQGRLHQCSHSDKRLRDGKGEWVADTDTALRSQDECSANARRLAACWNAFDNVRTDLIEHVGTTDSMEQACNALEQLPAALAQLAAARALLQELLDNSQAFPGALEMLDLDGMEWAERALAFLKGGA